MLKGSVQHLAFIVFLQTQRGFGTALYLPFCPCWEQAAEEEQLKCVIHVSHGHKVPWHSSPASHLSSFAGQLMRTPIGLKCEYLLKGLAGQESVHPAANYVIHSSVISWWWARESWRRIQNLPGNSIIYSLYIGNSSFLCCSHVKSFQRVILRENSCFFLVLLGFFPYMQITAVA